MREHARAYHASRNRREVFCEMSYHAGLGDLPNGEEAMAWVYKHVTSSEISDGWWSKRAPYYPMEHWFRQAEKGLRTAALGVSGTLGAIVSGAVTIVTAVSGAVRHALSPSFQASPPAALVATPIDQREVFMTTSPALEAMKREAAQLEQELQQVPLFRRLAALRGFIESYAAEHLSTLKGQAEPVAKRVRAGAKRAATAIKADAEQLISAAKTWLTNHGAPAFGKDIAEGLKAAGYSVGGKQPGRTIGSLLSRHPDFSYSKKAGFGLKNTDKAA
jgi:hypothetical protein